MDNNTLPASAFQFLAPAAIAPPGEGPSAPKERTLGSAEAEHRAILEKSLGKTRRRNFAQALLSMPDVGRDKD